MATASQIARDLVEEEICIFHGFWISHGTTAFPPGLALTVTTQMYAFLTAGTALFAAWVASRAWRILSVIIFGSIYKRTKASLEESQCAALLVNSEAPLSAGLAVRELAHHGRPKGTFIKIVSASIFSLLLRATIPAYVYVFPPHGGGLIIPKNCGYNSTLVGTPWAYVAKPKRLGNAALSSVDRNSKVTDMDKKASMLQSLPNITESQSYVPQCPADAICDPIHPFTFSSQYSLTSRHFGLNIDAPFTLNVNETCYRPIDASVPIGGDKVGLDYGPVVVTSGRINRYTAYLYTRQGNAPGDTLVSHWALADNVPGSNAWTPKSTLSLGGDTTILFYFIGFINLPIESSDPIFATSNKSDDDGLYLTTYTVATIVCDTKYQFCSNKTREQDCSPMGPMTQIMNWIHTIHASDGGVWGDIDIFFSGSTFIPPIAAASLGSDAIGSDQTLKHGTLQGDPRRTTAKRELGRLSHGGMAALASRSQLAALGYWDLGNGSTLVPARGLCKNVAIETPTVISISLTPFWPLLGISVTIIAFSYADFLGATKLQAWKRYKDAWTLYSVGQLHRQVAEQQWGKLHEADPSKKWPDLKSPVARGFDVVEKEGSMYLASRTCLIISILMPGPF